MIKLRNVEAVRERERERELYSNKIGRKVEGKKASICDIENKEQTKLVV